jgi:hypothetical protein
LALRLSSVETNGFIADISTTSSSSQLYPVFPRIVENVFMGARRSISFYEDNVVLMSPVIVAVEFVSGLLKVAMLSISHSQCLASLREALGGVTLL